MNMFFPGGWREQMGTMDVHIPFQTVGNQRATKRLSQPYDRLFVYIVFSLPSSNQRWLAGEPPFICHWPCLCAARVSSYHLLNVCETQICSPVSEPKPVQWLYLEVGTCGIDVCMLFLGSVGCKHPLKFCILCLATVSDKHIQTLVLVGCVLVSLNFNRIVSCTAPPVMWDGLHIQCSATFCYTVGWLPVSPGGDGHGACCPWLG
jgi:hypothetical protein